MNPKEFESEEKNVKDVIVFKVSIGFPIWRCHTFGARNLFVFEVEKPPCLFWRIMQYLCFGNIWEKIKKEEK